MKHRLHLWFEQHRVGRLDQATNGQPTFTYDDGWLAHDERFPISLSMPLHGETFPDPLTRAFFGGLLPDENVRARLAKHLGVSARNEFAMLREVGRECAGALALLPDDETPGPASTEPPRLLDDLTLANLLRELPRRPLLAGRELRLSLAGAQDKIAIVMVGERIALPAPGAPTSHILKVPIANYEATVANEFFCMQLAARCGIDTPGTSLRVVDGMPILLIERFDRHIDANGTLRRLHQEDCCQALGIPPDCKYQSEGGPGYAALFRLLTDHSTRAAADRVQLLQRVLFHFLVGNGDAHGKNFSLLLTRYGARLAPTYDVMSTLVYPDLSRRMAMKVGSRREFAEVQPEHWAAFAKEIGMSAPAVRDRLRELAASLPTTARQLATSLPALADTPLIDRLVEGIAERCRAVPSR